MRNIVWEIWYEKYGIKIKWKIRYEKYGMKNTIWKIRYEKYGMNNTVWKIRYEKYGMNNTVWKIRYKKYGMKYIHMKYIRNTYEIHTLIWRLWVAGTALQFPEAHDCAVAASAAAMFGSTKRSTPSLSPPLTNGFSYQKNRIIWGFHPIFGFSFWLTKVTRNQNIT